MITLQPYKHDCDRCIWMGWVTVGETYGNMYVCPTPNFTEIIIRWSDDPPDYSCYSRHKDSTQEPHPITIMGSVADKTLP